jgi:hypothetical protein
VEGAAKSAMERASSGVGRLGAWADDRSRTCLWGGGSFHGRDLLDPAIFESERTIEVGLAFEEERFLTVEISWIQPCLEPERTIEVGVPFGEEGPPTVEDSCVWACLAG